MKVILVHHADAVGPAVDPQRPLSARGREQAERLADALQQHGIVPAAIWHSGKLRSRQTAEAFLRRSPFADFRHVRGLRPDDPPAWIHTELVADTRDILLVGHIPNIFSLAQTLVPTGAALPLHGLVGFERDGDAWKEFLRLS